MLRQKGSLIKKISIGADLALIAISLILTYFLRIGWFRSFFREGIFPLKDYLLLLWLILPVWWIALFKFEVYVSMRRESFYEISWRIIKACVISILALGTLIFLFKITFVSRTFVFSFFLVSTFILILERILVYGFLKIARKRGFNYRNVVLVGTGRGAQSFIRTVRKHADWGFKILGLVDVDSQKIGAEVLGIKVIGKLDDILDILHQNVVDEVVFALPRRFLGDIEKPLLTCEQIGVRTHILVDWFNLSIAKTQLEEFHGIPMLTMSTTPFAEWKLLMKRFFDAVVSFLALVLLFPVFTLIAIGIKITSPGPIFFRQRRCGLAGRVFTLYKFRSMVKDAEKKLKEVKHLNEMNGPVFKIKDDPRITKFGKFLRKTSLDELPQLFNVLKGEMSLIGPRPPIPEEVDKYELWQKRRLSMRPGITCLWQISGRNEVDFNEWMKLDLEYIDNWSLGLDFKILLKTIPVVITGHGAR